MWNLSVFENYLYSFISEAWQHLIERPYFSSPEESAMQFLYYYYGFDINFLILQSDTLKCQIDGGGPTNQGGWKNIRNLMKWG